MRNIATLELTKSNFFLSLILLMSVTSTTLAQKNGELGRMWTFENPPLEYLETEYGFKPEQEWLDSLRLGSLRLVGEEIRSNIGSASFVSPSGLMLTSNRNVLEAVALTLDKAGHTREDDPPSILHAGFVAAAREQEIRLRLRGQSDPWLKAVQLIKISNVYDAVNQSVLPTDDEIQSRQKREANKQAILDAARQSDPDLLPQIVSFFQGTQSQLYQYKVYDDVRLVVLPHLPAAHFGGDSDNFTWPRYNLDFAFLRAYEDGKPADTTNHFFKWKLGGAQEEELVFVAGNPGKTKRWYTMAQFELERDIRLPMKIEPLVTRIPFLKKTFTFHWQTFKTTIMRWENELKVARGHLKALESANLMTQKTALEQAFKRRVMVSWRTRNSLRSTAICGAALMARISGPDDRVHKRRHPRQLRKCRR